MLENITLKELTRTVRSTYVIGKNNAAEIEEIG